jgi:chromosome segregation ATPase
MTDARRSGPPGPEPRRPPQAAADALSDVVELARQEGALEGEALVAFVAALRERARLVLSERQDRLPQLEAENAWRKDAMTTLQASLQSLEAEAGWRRESMAALETSVRSLGEQAEALRAELRRASEAHDALLAHQRELVERVASELVAVAALSPLRARQARRRLRALAERLRVDSR